MVLGNIEHCLLLVGPGTYTLASQHDGKSTQHLFYRAHAPDSYEHNVMGLLPAKLIHLGALVATRF